MKDDPVFGFVPELENDSSSKLIQSQVAQAQRNALAKTVRNTDGQLILPLFPAATRILPNDLARCSLFTTRSASTKREYLNRQALISTQDGTDITYTGEELRTIDDELVFLQILSYARDTVLGESFRFTLYDLCEQLGWHRNGRYYAKCEDSLNRMAATNLNFNSVRYAVLEGLSLIRRFRIVNKGTRHAYCEAFLEPEIALLFAGKHFSRLDWVKYRDLSPTARRLYDYCCSHAAPHPLPVDTFHQICSSDCKDARKYNQIVKKACNELIESGLVLHVELRKDKRIHFERETLQTRKAFKG